MDYSEEFLISTLLGAGKSMFGSVISTLLGPWRSETITRGHLEFDSFGQVRICEGNQAVRNRPYFENYIVDASIF